MNNENIFYVYLHRRATDNKVFYVGKGKGNRAYKLHGRNKYWKHTYAKHGMNVEIVFDNLSEEDSLLIEKDTILEMRYFGYPLCNLTDGGEGISGLKQTPENIAKRIAANTGRKHTAEAKLKMSLASKGKCKSLEQRLAQSQRMKGVKQPAERVRKIADKLRGRKHSEQALTNIKAGQARRTPEEKEITRLKLRTLHLGENNPSADKRIHTFINVKTLEVFIGTRVQMCNKYGIHSNRIGTLFLKGKIAAGWSLLKEQNGTNKTEEKT